MNREVHHQGHCAGDFDDDYEIGYDSDGDYLLYEKEVSMYSVGDPTMYAIIKYCPFCGKKLGE